MGGIARVASRPTFCQNSSNYQADKFIKHTRPDRIYSINSLFDDPSTNVYRDYVINSAAGGSVELDDFGRTNFVWVAGENVGLTYIDGELKGPADAIKLVLPFDSEKIHAFPFISIELEELACQICGAQILG